MRRGWWLGVAMTALAASCAAPDPDPYIKLAANAAETPRIVGARGPLSRAESRRIVERLEQENGGSDLLRRHLAIEEAIAEQPLVAGNKVTLLEDGPATFRAMLADIARAKHHVNIEFFIIDDEGIGETFADAILQKRREGVAVNLIYDAVGSIQTSAAYFDRLRQAGIRVLEFHPLNPAAGRRALSPNNRDHRKILVVDGRVAYTGGINISSVYGDAGGSHPARHEQKDKKGKERWRDTQVRLEGPVAAEFQRLFLAQWRGESGDDLPDAGFFPKLAPAGDALVRVIATSAEKEKPEFLADLVSAVNNAETSVSITQAYFAPPPEELRALEEAARRGVQVRLVLPKKSDQPKVVYAGRAHYGELLDSGVEIWERRDVLLHAKTAVVDGVWSVVGSANLDYRSVLYNDEVNAIVLGPRFGTEMEAMFTRDLERSDRVDPQKWRDRSFFSRTKEWLASLLEPWI